MGFMYYIYLIFFSILAMRETQKEGKKLALLNKYKRAVVRVQLPDRYVIQAVFPPGAGNFFNNVCQGDLSRCIDNNTIRRYRILIYLLIISFSSFEQPIRISNFGNDFFVYLLYEYFYKVKVLN